MARRFPDPGMVNGVGAMLLLAAFWEQRAERLRKRDKREVAFLLSDQFPVWCDLDGYGSVADRRARLLSLYEVRFGEENLLERAPCPGCGKDDPADFWLNRKYCRHCEKKWQRAREGK